MSKRRMTDSKAKTGIPVKRWHGATKYDKPAVTDVYRKHTNGGKTGNGPAPTNSQNRRRNSDKDLSEENSKLKTEIAGCEERLKKLEEILQIEQDRAVEIRKDAERNENKYKENIEDLSKKLELLKSRMEAYEKKLLLCNIDPVTLKSLDPSKQDTEEISRKRQNTKDQMQNLKKRLEEFNKHSSKYIQNVKAVGCELDSLLQDNSTVKENNDT